VSVYLRNTTRRHRIDERGVRRIARRLLDAAGEPSASLSLSFVGDRAIRTLNRRHRGKDRATDVLSFPLLEHTNGRVKAASSHAAERLLGDVVISLDTARRQAGAYDATLDAEVQRLLIHGVLHLLGHDHERPREGAKMRSAERRLAAAIGLPWPY
jgi:probable rRNA maturation factor